MATAAKVIENSPAGAKAGNIAADNWLRRDIKPLTSLRLFPAFAVVIYHAGEFFSCWNGVVTSPFTFEYAVTFFFVLSGFILTLNYFQMQGTKAVWKFYLARFARVWPAHAASLCLLLFLIPEIFKVKNSMMPVFLSNLFLCHSWIPSWKVYFSFNAPSWTNSTEFFFYVCFPLLLWGMKKRWYAPLLTSAAVLLGIISLSNWLKLPEFDPTALCYQGLVCIHPFARINEFCVGMLAAVFFHNKLTKLQLSAAKATLLEVGIVALLCCCNLISKPLRYASVNLLGAAGAYWLQNSALALLCFAVLIPLFALEKGHLSRIFSHPLLVKLGELSFGVYMLHGVFITFLGVNFPQAQSLSMCLAFLTVVLLSAHLMAELFEKPVRNLLMSLGNKAISSFVKNPGDNEKAASKKVEKKKPSFTYYAVLSLEAAAIAGIVYFSLPTVHAVSKDEAIKLQERSSLAVIEFKPYLRLNSASAKQEQEKKKIRLDLSWQALKDEDVNFLVTVLLKDSSGQVIGSSNYLQDGRKTRVKAGSYWFETVDVDFRGDKTPSAAAVTVSYRKREALHSLKGPQDCSFVVSVQD